MSPEKRETLRLFIRDNCLSTGAQSAITLSGGAQTSFYFDCKRATLHGHYLSLIADLLLELIEKEGWESTAIGGKTVGADFIVAAVVARAHEKGSPVINGSILRKEPKKHGTCKMIENEMPTGTRIVVVDDVVTSGGSVSDACEAFIEEGCKLVGMLSLIDRNAGGREFLEGKFGVPLKSLFSLEDFQDKLSG